MKEKKMVLHIYLVIKNTYNESKFSSKNGPKLGRDIHHPANWRLHTLASLSVSEISVNTSASRINCR